MPFYVTTVRRREQWGNAVRERVVTGRGNSELRSGEEPAVPSRRARRHRTATRNERRDPRDQTECDQEAAREFDPGAKIHDPLTSTVTARRKSQEFLTAVTSEEETDNQPHNAINGIREALQ